MWKFIISNTVFWKGMLVCFILGFVSQLIVNFSYLSMLRVTQEIGRTRKRWILSLKKKYQNYGKLGVQVQHIDSFVGRQIQKQKFFLFRLDTWEMFANEFRYLCALLGGYGAVYLIYIGGSAQRQTLTLFTGIFAAGVLTFLKIACQIPQKKINILYNIEDYLENILKNHLYSDETDNIYGRRTRTSGQGESLREVATARMKPAEPRKSKVSQEEEKLVEEVLKDYFES